MGPWAALPIVLAAAAVGVGWALLARRRRRALNELRRGLEALAAGRPTRAVLGRFVGAPGALTRVFNEAVPRIEDRLARLEDDRRLLQTVLEAMREAVLAVDDRRRLLFANAAAARLFGLRDGRGRLLAELIRSPRVHEVVESTLARPEPFHAEIQLAPARAAGPARTLAVHGTRLSGAEAPGAVLVFHDVTELRHLERMRVDFVANASHELKTPLAAIKAYTETLLDGALHDESVNAEFLRRIDEQADRLDALVLDLLRLARLDSGQAGFVHEPLAIVPVVRDCVRTHEDRAHARRIALAYLADGIDEETRVRADAEAIRQVLDNLIDNALKYTPAGGRVRVACRAIDGEVELEVADTGIGIPRDELPRIFERFYRVDRGRSRSVGGTGLGLAIVKHLVGSLGGRIEVESRLNAGSTFRVRLPRT
jgi:two-component system phosphate regulon sensor histidine kinase PhoR